MTEVVALADALDESRFGAKATGLGAAARAGLPIPPGIALSGSFVDAVAAGHEARPRAAHDGGPFAEGPLAVRSSAADEDGADASFAGQHLTLLNVPSVDDLRAAIPEIWWSANSDSAITYRQRVGLFTRPSVGVVVQSLLDPAVAGVLFTQNPINKADERLIEASWGLGEVVVAGRVIPDSFRIDRTGAVCDRTPGVKKIAIRAAADGGTYRGDGRPGARGDAVSRRRSARAAQRSCRPVRGDLRTGPRHRVGVCRRAALPSAVPRRHAGRFIAHHRSSRPVRTDRSRSSSACRCSPI